eukprot:1320415-Pleurochrysis_carterae.AAC.1
MPLNGSGWLLLASFSSLYEETTGLDSSAPFPVVVEQQRCSNGGWPQTPWLCQATFPANRWVWSNDGGMMYDDKGDGGARAASAI